MSAQQIERFPTTPLTAAQIADILRVSEIGALWIAGKMSFEEVEMSLGKLKQYGSTDPSYGYIAKGYAAFFDLNSAKEINQSYRGRGFNVVLDESKSASIPRETFEQRLGLVRSIPGELIDNVRREEVEYLAKPFMPTQIPDEVGLNLRMPMPDDSSYDVRARFVYRIIPDQPAESKFESTTNFRSFEIHRRYLPPDELEDRNHAKRMKYGAMNLCTGMICPETGWWQAWTDAGQSGKPFVWWADRKFDMAFHPLPSVGRLVNARFTWVKTYIPSPY